MSKQDVGVVLDWERTGGSKVGGCGHGRFRLRHNDSMRPQADTARHSRSRDSQSPIANCKWQIHRMSVHLDLSVVSRRIDTAMLPQWSVLGGSGSRRHRRLRRRPS
jgi:hypothetical protein